MWVCPKIARLIGKHHQPPDFLYPIFRYFPVSCLAWRREQLPQEQFYQRWSTSNVVSDCWREFQKSSCAERATVMALIGLHEFLTRIPLSPGIGGDFRDAILKLRNPPCTAVQGVVLLLEGSTSSSWSSLATLKLFGHFSSAPADAHKSAS